MNKTLHCIWIGDETKRPDKWIKTWKDKHPGWEYILWDNEALIARDWHNKELLQSYLSEGRYPVVADIMRYQILYEYGGFMHPADSVCLEPTDELFTDYDSYAVYENETVRPGLISPLYGAEKGSTFAYELMTNLPKVAPKAKDGRNKAPWQVTGNLYMQKMYAKTKANVKVFPSYTFTPIHYTGETYKGNDKVYAVQMWGTTAEWTNKPVDYHRLWLKQQRNG